jgi:hypothetical protein
MSPDGFVQAIQHAVVRDNLAVYNEMFRTTPVDRAVDPLWIRALTMFNSLDDEGKYTLIEVIANVMVDTTANILGIVDGCCPVSGVDGDVTLSVGGQVIGGELQELFLELNETG